MTRIIGIALLILFGAIFSLAQTSSARTHPLQVQECVGQKWSVLQGDVLASPYREKENWKKLLRANSGFQKEGRIIGSQQSATILPGDVICFPEGTVVADFIKNGDYSPTLVIFSENSVPLSAAQEPKKESNLLFVLIVVAIFGLAMSLLYKLFGKPNILS